MYSAFRFSLIVMILQIPLHSAAQRYLQEVFPQVTVSESILYGVNATVINAASTGTADPENLLLDFYEPQGDTAALRPLIIYLHTGNFLPFPQNQTPSGTRSDLHVVELCTRWAKRGYVVASCDYRLGWLPASSDQDLRNNTLVNAIYRGMQDARTAARFFRRLAAESANPYRIDVNRIVIAGEGAGAMIALTAATVDAAADFNLPKFIQNGTPMINELVNGNADGTSVGINPLNFDTLCYINHPGYSSDFNAAFNLSGALPEISWITSTDPSIFSVHSPTDPFFPYLTDTMNVSVLNYPLFEVSGSGSIQQAINQLGNDGDFLVLNEGCDEVSATANSNNNGITGLYPLIRPSDMYNDAFPWEWWSITNINSANGLAVNSDMSESKSILFQDTILAFLSPRLMCALQLDGNPCDAGLYGCMDAAACNYCGGAINDDGSCHFIGDFCDDGNATTFGEIWSNDCACTPPVSGCMNDAACNYNPLAAAEDGSCSFTGDACDDGVSSTSSDTYDMDCNCVGTPISPSGCNPSDINWATQTYFVSPNPNAGETLADGITGVYYSDNIYLKVPTNIQQVVPTAPSVNITSLTINNILITPSGSATAVSLSSLGLSYQCNSFGAVGNCVFLPNQPSCIEIYGVPNATGLYTLTFSVTASAGFINLPYQLQVMTISIGGPGCTDSTACNFDANASVNNGSCFSQGDACSDGLEYTINDAINNDCICEGACAAIIPNASYQTISCFGEETMVTFSYNGGMNPEAVVINGTDTTFSNTISLGSGAISYYLITEGNCVSATQTLNIIQPPVLTLEISNIQNVQCRGYATGSASVNATGGTGSYTYEWSNGAITNTVSELVAGAYSIMITDENGCFAEATINIAEPSSSLGITAFTINPTCGSNNGTINIQTTHAVGTTSFNWNGSDGTNQIENVGAGIYALIVQDDFCTIDTTLILNPSNGPEISNYSVDHVTCFGGNDGSINIEITGGTTPVYAQWLDDANGLTRTNLSAGLYSVTLTDAQNCTFIQEFTVEQPDEILAFTTLQSVECFGDNSGSVAFEITGGIQPYSIQWNGGTPTNQLLFSELTAGDYAFAISDSAGCSLAVQVTIEGPGAPLQVSIEGDSIICGDSLGSATALVTGAETVNYLWNNGAITQEITDIPVGEYFVIASSGSCSDTAYFFLGNNLPVIQDSIQNISCYGLNNGYAAAIVSGGTLPYTYEWNAFPGTPAVDNPNAEVQTSLPPGNYYVSVAEASADACVNGFSFTITEPSAMSINTENLNNVSCNGLNDGAITISVEGGTAGYNVFWSNGSMNTAIENLAAGNYFVTASDANGCTVSTNYELTEPSSLVTTDEIIDVTCFGYEDGSLTISPSGGTAPYSIHWNNSNLPADFTLINLAAGEYTYSVSDALGCVLAGTAAIEGPASQLTVNITGDAIVCGDSLGIIEATVSGNTANILYEWQKEGTGILNETSAIVDSVTVGLYTVIITSAGCTASDQFFLGNNLPLLSTSFGDVHCYGGNDGFASVSPNGGQPPYSYQWYSLNGSPALTNPTDSAQNSLSAGTYAVTVSETSGCISSYEFQITQPELLQINTTVENASCVNDFLGSVAIQITGGVEPYVILWENGATSTSIENLSPGSYDVVVYDDLQCGLMQTVSVNQSGVTLTVNFNTVAPSCGNPDGSIISEVITSNGNVSYTWNGLNGEATAQNLLAGTYTISYSDDLCSGSAEIILATTSGPQIDSAVVIPVSCFGGSDGEVQLSYTASTPVTFTWSDSSNEQNLTNATADTFSVILTDTNACTYTASYFVSQPEALMVNITSQDNHCFGGTEGLVNFEITGGVSPYTVIWQDMSFNDVLTFGALTAGMYNFSVSDAENCVNGGAVEILQPEAIEVDFQILNITCSTLAGTIFTAVAGGSAPYTYQWSNGDSLDYISGLSAGTYVLQIQDSFGCEISDSADIQNLSASLEVNTTATQPSCNGEMDGSILINEVLGGYEPYTYEWNNSAGQGNYAGNLSAGEYSLTITDSTGCQYDTTITLIDPVALSGNISGPTVVIAGDTAVYQFSLSGGNYLWSNTSGMTLGSSNEMTYSIMWTDSANDVVQLIYTDTNGCSITTTLDINIQPLGMPELSAAHLHLYPVPASHELNLKTDSKLLGMPWKITDMYGRNCLNGAVNYNTKVDVSTLTPGTYIFTIGSVELPFVIAR